MLDELKNAGKVVGIKQLRRALPNGNIKKVFLADDADPRLTEPLAEQCEALYIDWEMVASMQELGKACGIDVGAAAAGVLR